MKGYYAGVDIDTSRLAEVLRDLADDIEEHGVAVEQVMAYTDAKPEDAVEFGVGLKLNAMVGSKTLGNLAHEYEERDEARPIR